MPRLCEGMSVWVTLVRLKQNKAPSFPQPCWIGLFPTDVVHELTFFCRLSSWAVVSLIPHVSLYLDSAPSTHPNSTWTRISPFPISQCPFHSCFKLSFLFLILFFSFANQFHEYHRISDALGGVIEVCTSHALHRIVSMRILISLNETVVPACCREIFFADKVAALQENPKKKQDCLMLEHPLSLCEEFLSCPAAPGHTFNNPPDTLSSKSLFMGSASRLGRNSPSAHYPSLKLDTFQGRSSAATAQIFRCVGAPPSLILLSALS